MIARKARQPIIKRQQSDIVKKHAKIGNFLDLKKVPVHTLAWKEARLELGDGDCYPVVDVIERMAEMLFVLSRKPAKKRKKADG